MTKIKDIMTTEVLTIDADQKVADAHELMTKHNIRHLIVTAKEKPIGILSNRNISVAVYLSILDSAASRENKTTVGDLCSRCPTNLTPNSTVLEAAKVLQERKISAFPVQEENGELTGIVTSYDLLNVLISLLEKS